MLFVTIGASRIEFPWQSISGALRELYALDMHMMTEISEDVEKDAILNGKPVQGDCSVVQIAHFCIVGLYHCHMVLCSQVCKKLL